VLLISKLNSMLRIYTIDADFTSCSGGNPYSYCGLSETNVCCFVPKGAKPVGLLPPSRGQRPNKGRCGKKGNDAGQDGIAEPAEWPWHVSHVDDILLRVKFKNGWGGGGKA
jgi:hypothetical protein